jgi:transcriptional regulator with XRE-family HTH domain
MHKLHSYLTGRRKSAFAATVGISPAYLSQILSGHRRPSLSLMERIEAASDGLVDLNSWSSFNRPHNLAGRKVGSNQYTEVCNVGDMPQ